MNERVERISWSEVDCKYLASWDGSVLIRQEASKARPFGPRPQGGLRAQVQKWRNLTVAVERKDGYTHDHCNRIKELSVQVGQRLDLAPELQYTLYHGALLHDLGKVVIPDSILQKPDRLTPEEWRIMKMHPEIGGQMLQGTAISEAARVLEQHHERLDGSGYPRGLRGDQICLEAQIVAVVDSYDAMTTDRVYRPALPAQTALDELRRGAGRLYSEPVVEAFMELIAG